MVTALRQEREKCGMRHFSRTSGAQAMRLAASGGSGHFVTSTTG